VKVLVVANDHVGSSMAGPGIRSLRFAQELSQRFDVTLQIPYATDIGTDGVRIIVGNPYDARRMTTLTTSYGAVVAQRLPVPTLRALAGSRTRTIYDLYAPLTIENLAFDAGRSLNRVESAYFRLNTLVQEAVLRYGDAFICASETQRDLWLGSLLALGRVDHDSYAADPSLRDLIDVVPFGIEPEPPLPGAAIRGVVPGIGEQSRVLLWPGGIWNWFDPLTVIRAVAELRRSGTDLWLVFLGIRHPNPGVPAMEMTRRAIALADELGLTGDGVHFNEHWVPYAERGAWLLEADLGVSAHLDELESRFAYRTRLLDCFWAGLPVVVTEGDALGRLVADRGLGRVVAPADVHGWRDAIASLLDDEKLLEQARREMSDVRAELAWPRVVERLAELLEARSTAPPRPRNGVLATYAARRVEYAVASRGIGGAARRLAAIAGERVGLARGAGRE
jgi:glycosyltransferase involved in cell wall biosynthesis